MNYLAHLFLADDTPESILGSLMGDFVKGPVTATSIGASVVANRSHLDQISLDVALIEAKKLCVEKLCKAIMEHRRIDTFTDAHPLVRASKGRIAEPYRRYAGILVDVFYDHFLALHWAQFSSVSLSDFSRQRYAVLERHFTTLPSSMHRLVRYMVSRDLLGSYANLEGIGNALRGIEMRLKRPSQLSQAVEQLELNKRHLKQDFNDFLPELIAFVQSERRDQALSAGAYSHPVTTHC